MRQARLLIHEPDGSLAEELRPLAEERRWLLRTVRRPEEVEDLPGAGEGSVTVLKVGRDLDAEFRLLARLTRRYPEMPVVVVADGEGPRRRPQLAGLAWDLGAAYVLFPPLPARLLGPIVAGLMGKERDDAVAAADPG